MTLDEAIEKLWKVTVDNRAYNETLPDLMTIEEMKKMKIIILPERSAGKTYTSLVLAFKRAYELFKYTPKISPFIYIKENKK